MRLSHVHYVLFNKGEKHVLYFRNVSIKLGIFNAT